MTTADAKGLIDAIRADPFDPVNRLVYADWLADVSDAEEEAWHRWVAAKCGRMANLELVVYMVKMSAAHPPPHTRLFGSVESLSDFRNRPGRRICPFPFRVNSDIVHVADQPEGCHLLSLSAQKGDAEQSISYADARRILREAFPDEGKP